MQCVFDRQPDFTGATLTNVSFIQCSKLTTNIPPLLGASRDGVTFDVPGLKEKNLF